MKSTFFFNERLVQAMNNMLKFPLTIVSAQIGAGKTTAVRSALMNQPNQTVLWHTIYKKNTQSLWQDFCEKIGALDESSGKLLWELGEDIPTKENALRRVAQVLSALTGSLKITIVIDNYTETERLLNLLYYLIWQSIDNLHIIIISRKNVPIDYELGLAGDVFYVDNSVFMLKEEDIVHYYQKAEIPISDEEVERIHRISGGWLPLLQSIGELLINNTILPESTDLKDCIRTMMAYMDQYLLSEISASFRRFLLIFGYVDGFTPEFVSTYIDVFKTDSEKDFPEEFQAEGLLSFLMQNNLFLEYDSVHRVYCFQYVFQLAMREEYERLSTAEQEQLARTWVRAESAYTGIWDGNRGYNGRVLHFALHAFDEEKDDIDYLLYLGLYFQIRDDEEGYQEVMSKTAHFLETHESVTAPPEYLLLKSRLGYSSTEDFHEYIMTCAHAISAENAGHYGMAWGNLMLCENFTSAKEMEDLIQKLDEELPECRGSSADIYKGWLSLLKGEQYMLRYDLDNAKINLYASYRFLPEMKDPALDAVRSYLDISIQFYSGEMDEARTRLHAAKEEQLQLHRDSVLTALDLGWRWRAGKNSIGDESERFSVNNETVYGCDTLRELISAEDLILNNQYLPFMGYFHNSEKAFNGSNFYFRIYMLLYCAIACKNTQRLKESMDYFNSAVKEAQEGEIYLPFLTLGFDLTSFLEESAETDETSAEFVRILREKIELYQATKNEKAKIGLWRIQTSEELTDRERQICYCVHDGLSNKEIGFKLMISENTVKSALKSIFKKLEITSRDML